MARLKPVSDAGTVPPETGEEERRRVPGELGPPPPQTLQDALQRIEVLERKAEDATTNLQLCKGAFDSLDAAFNAMSRVLAAQSRELDAMQAKQEWMVGYLTGGGATTPGPQLHPNAVGVVPPKSIDDLPGIDDLPQNLMHGDAALALAASAPGVWVRRPHWPANQKVARHSAGLFVRLTPEGLLEGYRPSEADREARDWIRVDLPPPGK